jgi:hypothetical protein
MLPTSQKAISNEVPAGEGYQIKVGERRHFPGQSANSREGQVAAKE